MFKIEKPKIIRAYVVSYDEKTHSMYYEIQEIYDNEDDLARYLAKFHRPAYNIWGDKMNNTNSIWNPKNPNACTNRYMDYQAFNGIVHISEIEKTFYSNLIDSNNCLKLNEDSWIGRHIFFLDTKDRPYYDVRNLNTRVEELIRNENIEYSPGKPIYFKRRGSRPRSHTVYPYRRTTRYIQRARMACAIEAEPEYKQFAKVKDKNFRSVWPWEDFSSRRSSGWKDNPGEKNKHQWERKAKREYNKTKKELKKY